MKSKIFLSGLVLAAALAVQGQEEPNGHFHFESIGVRYGYGADRLSRNFQEIEALGNFTLPFKLDLGKTWEVNPRLEFALGSLGNDHVTAVVGSIGPVLSIGPVEFPLKAEVGLAPTGLSERDFETRRVGSRLQFRSWFGLSWTIEKRVRVAYHFQHMSNGGLAGDNEGVNMHTASVTYCF